MLLSFSRLIKSIVEYIYTTSNIDEGRGWMLKKILKSYDYSIVIVLCPVNYFWTDYGL